MVLNQKYRITSEIRRKHGLDIMDLTYIKSTDVDHHHITENGFASFLQKIKYKYKLIQKFKQFGNHTSTSA